MAAMTDCDLSTWSDVQFDTYVSKRTMKKLVTLFYNECLQARQNGGCL